MKRRLFFEPRSVTGSKNDQVLHSSMSRISFVSKQTEHFPRSLYTLNKIKKMDSSEFLTEFIFSEAVIFRAMTKIDQE